MRCKCLNFRKPTNNKIYHEESWHQLDLLRKKEKVACRICKHNNFLKTRNSKGTFEETKGWASSIVFVDEVRIQRQETNLRSTKFWRREFSNQSKRISWRNTCVTTKSCKLRSLLTKQVSLSCNICNVI